MHACARRLLATAASFAALAVHATLALDNGLGSTPPLAYSTWNYFNDAINDTLVRELADALVSTGLAEVGYKTVNIDAGYLIHERDPQTQRLQVNRTKFPHGMRPLADYLGAKGMGLGVYTDHGNGSCGFGPGSYGHYALDAQTFADWRVSYLKVDFCGFHPGVPTPGDPRGVPTFQDWMDPAQQLHRWQELRDALNKTGRQIYYSICPHGHVPATGPSEPWYKNGTGLVYAPPLVWTEEQHKATANSILTEYTNLFDFWYSDHWQDFRRCGPTPTCPECPYVGGVTHSSCSKFPNGSTNAAVPLSPGGFLTDVDAMTQLTKPRYSGKGTWADGDMLMVCNFGGGGAKAGGRHDGGMTLEEYRSSYSLWAILASPIIISADIRSLAREHPDCLAMLTNKELIAISQDELGLPGRMIRQRLNTSAPTSESAARHTNIVEQVFTRPLAGGQQAVALFNRAEAPRNMSVTWHELGLRPDAAYSVRDIWAHNAHGEDVGVHAQGYSVVVQPHAAATLRLAPSALARQ